MKRGENAKPQIPTYYLRCVVVAFALLVLPHIAFPVRADTPEFKVWSMEVFQRVYDFDADAERPPLEPVRIAGTRNGTFSGAVIVEADAPITGLHAQLDPAPGEGKPMDGDDTEQVAVRYAMPWVYGRQQRRPMGLDKLLESPPEEVPCVDGIGRPRGNRAMVGVWVTVDVPADAEPGSYHGMLRIEADGLARQDVPVVLEVADWTVPPPAEWRTWIELMQSPDTLAVEYEVPLWSERHEELIARSFREMQRASSRVLYIPLLRETNHGNEESMIRWVRNEDGSLEPDYSVMERYLDVAQENLDEIEMVVLYLWDVYLAELSEERPELTDDLPTHSRVLREARQAAWDARQEGGLTVTIVDGASGEVEAGHLPHYIEPDQRERWTGVFEELRRRLRARELEEAMVLGMVSDHSPTKETVAFLDDVSGGLPWISHSHSPRSTKGNPPPNQRIRELADLVYVAHAWEMEYQINPELGRMYGWKIPELRAFLCRFNTLNGHPLAVRHVPIKNITGNQRGVGRIGADFWPALRDRRRGHRQGEVYARYPKNHWRNLNIENWMLAPGPDGPVSTVRFENLIEGAQETEARITIEEALLDSEARARLGKELAEEAQDLLDERQLAFWRSVWPRPDELQQIGAIGQRGNPRNPYEAIWSALAEIGHDMPGYWDGEARQMRRDAQEEGRNWFAASDWRERNLRLFRMAAEIEEAVSQGENDESAP